jgi:drug/metabolite transporter (DMT)-like permease
MSAPFLVDTLRPRPSGTIRRRRLAVVAAVAAVALSAALGGTALVDRFGGEGLADHATSVYAAHGEDPDPNLLYGLVGTVAVVGVGLWSLVLWTVLARRRWATVLAAAAVLMTAGLAVALLTASEYGERIFPVRWGLLALLGPVAGAATVVALATGRRAGVAIDDDDRHEP